MDQTEKPLKTQQHPAEEEVHHENGASKMFRKVKAKAKKFKNSITKHGQSHEHDDHDVVEEDDEDDELEPEVISAPVKGGVTDQPESLNHLKETNIQVPETKDFPVVSSNYTKPIEPVSLQNTVYGHEVLSNPVRTTDISNREEQTHHHHPLILSELSDREESREAHHEALNTPMSLLSETEDVTNTFIPGGENEYLGGQRKVNVETPKKSDYFSDVTHEGGEAQVPEITQSLGSLKVTESAKDSPLSYGTELEKDLSTRSHVLDMKTESRIDKNSPSRSHEFDLKTESGVHKNSPAGFSGESITGLEEDSSRRSYAVSAHKTETEKVNNSPTGYNGDLGDKLGQDFSRRRYESEQMDKNSSTGLCSASVVGLGEDFPAEESNGYGEESEAGLEITYPARSDDVKVETELGRDLTTETHDQFSPELSRLKERDDFEESRDSFEEIKDESHEPKPSSYTDPIASATSTISNKVLAAKDAVASKLGYPGESPKVDGTVDEKLTPVKETETKFPLSGSGSDLEEKQQEEVEKGVPARGYLAEKLKPGEEDKVLSEMIAEKLHLGGGEKKTTKTKEMEVTVEKIPDEKEPEEKEHDEAVTEEVKGGGGGGMVGMIKGWFGGGVTEEVQPKSPQSVEESSQSLGSTVGTMGFSDSDRSDLRETGCGNGVVPMRRELGN